MIYYEIDKELYNDFSREITGDNVKYSEDWSKLVSMYNGFNGPTCIVENSCTNVFLCDTVKSVQGELIAKNHYSVGIWHKLFGLSPKCFSVSSKTLTSEHNSPHILVARIVEEDERLVRHETTPFYYAIGFTDANFVDQDLFPNKTTEVELNPADDTTILPFFSKKYYEFMSIYEKENKKGATGFKSPIIGGLQKKQAGDNAYKNVVNLNEIEAEILSEPSMGENESE